ncbi:polysaccharide deacetylase family protein [Flavimaricola marinus]|uniref:Chitooligosaccharide deacetylase n=1 Tax=Flavimaricola marinus TaxID=1819565 RepID=A0A238LKB0_9RHOB|nr:polysaccharide deacetylase family protein [Flavimaricola marinus]SMY09310.1 Peptidoglycan-N-acetylglucosamine deacetylase [Flavimaricola marinus]
MTIALLFVLTAFIIVVGWYALPFLVRRRSESLLRDKVRGSLVLSYDDGPGTDLTAELLDLLDAENLRATFFMIGDAAAARPDRVAEVLARGHEVGSHTQSHSNAWKVPPLRAIRDMRAGRVTVDALGGDGTLFRPPYGKLTLGTLAAAAGWRLAWWSIDPRDSWAPRPIDEVLAEVEAAQGGVILLHDFDKPRRDQLSPSDHHDYVLEMTRRLILLAKQKGWAVRTMGDLMRDGADV